VLLLVVELPVFGSAPDASMFDNNELFVLDMLDMLLLRYFLLRVLFALSYLKPKLGRRLRAVRDLRTTKP
jgi:hypothetical protein